MDQATFERETSLTRQAYEKLRDRIRREHQGQYVALAGGKVVAAAPTYDEAVAAVQARTPVPEFFLVFPAEEEPVFEPYFSY